MSGGGGKGGSETTKTEVPDWIKQPAIRNLQRAEDVQRIAYMPYRGPEVAAFNATQNAAMNNNIATAKAFGLLDPDSTLTATTGMPTPTDFNGFSGYSSMPLYDQALAETKAAQPEAVALYDSLFGSNAMARLNASRGTGGRGRSASPSPARNYTRNAPLDTPDLVLKDRDGNIVNSVAPEMTVSYNPPNLDAYGNLPSAPLNTPNFNLQPPTRTPTMDDTADIEAGMRGNVSSRFDSKGYTPAPVSRPIDEIVAGYRSGK